MTNHKIKIKKRYEDVITSFGSELETRRKLSLWFSCFTMREDFNILDEYDKAAMTWQFTQLLEMFISTNRREL